MWPLLDVFETPDRRSVGIRNCCETLAETGGHKCEFCGQRGVRSNSLDDVRAVICELTGLLKDDDATNAREES